MTGINGQIGWASEAAYGTIVTPTKFAPFLSESIKNDGGARLVSAGIRGGRRFPSAHKRGGKTIGGSVSMEFGNTDVASLLRHLFGTVATTGVGPYTHTYTPGTLDDKSLTVQVGRPDLSGVVRARTFSGCKIPSWTLSCEAGSLAQLEMEVSAQDETGVTALAAASYTAGWAPFSFVDGSITNNAGAITVDSWSISGANTLRTDRFAVGSNKITRQVGNGWRELTVSLTMDFESLAMYDQFLNDTATTLVLKLDNGTQSFQVTAKGFLTGESPAVEGPEVLKQPVGFVAESGTSDADGLTAVLTNSESSAAA